MYPGYTCRKINAHQICVPLKTLLNFNCQLDFETVATGLNFKYTMFLYKPRYRAPVRPNLDVQDAKLRVSESKDDGVVVPLVMQNKPPPVEGREGDELADVELRPEQV